MIYFFPKIYKCNVQRFIRKRAWNTLGNYNAHDRGLCLWRRVLPVTKYIWKDHPEKEPYFSGKRGWFLDWKDKSVFELLGKI